MKYDYLIVGAGLFGCVFAREALDAGKTCLVIDRREHIAGNIYTEAVEDINVHRYGAHIFHTSDKKVWNYVNRYAEFNGYVNSPIANYKGEIYNLPFNMNTFYRLWGVVTPDEAKDVIAAQIARENIKEPENLEERALTLAGRDIYEKLIKGYTEKQWGRKATELPAFIINRVPLRFTYDNNYFNDRYQGIPVGGYTRFAQNLLRGADFMLNKDFSELRHRWRDMAERLVYTGMIDEYFGFALGALEYRSLRFETEVKPIENYQGNAVINYTDASVPYTRIIEHKHFEFGKQPVTVITREYPSEWKLGEEPYYPINDARNGELYKKYRELANAESGVLFGGRLGEYRYYDMDKVIASALTLAHREL